MTKGDIAALVKGIGPVLKDQLQAEVRRQLDEYAQRRAVTVAEQATRLETLEAENRALAERLEQLEKHAGPRRIAS